MCYIPRKIESIQKLKYYLISETCLAVPTHCLAFEKSPCELSLSRARGLCLFVQRWTSVFACLIWVCVSGKLKLMVYLWFRKCHTDISKPPPFNLILLLIKNGFSRRKKKRPLYLSHLSACLGKVLWKVLEILRSVSILWSEKKYWFVHFWQLSRRRFQQANHSIVNRGPLFAMSFSWSRCDFLKIFCGSHLVWLLRGFQIQWHSL